MNGPRRRSQHRLPETNTLVPLDSVAEVSNTPTSKGVSCDSSPRRRRAIAGCAMELDRRSLLAAAPLLIAEMPAGDKAADLDNFKLSPVPEAVPRPKQQFVHPQQ